MNDPHVESIEYSFRALSKGSDYSKAHPFSAQIGDFNVTLIGAALLAKPRVDMASEEEARDALEPHLRAWELRSDLEDDISIGFTFEGSSVIDRSPTSGQHVVVVKTVSEVGFAGQVSAVVLRSHFPAPATLPLGKDALVDFLVRTIHEVRSGSQRLLVAAYLFLTRIESEFGRRDLGAVALHVHDKVLRKLGELSVVNDPFEGRKARGPSRTLTEIERAWINSAMRRIALQAAELAGGGAPAELTLNELPTL